MNKVLPPLAPKSLDGIAQLLQSRTNRYAWIGLGIAAAALLVGTLLSALLRSGSISLQALVDAQVDNPALWLLDGMPFLFLLWGQYVGTLLSYQASAMVLDETRDLRERAHALEFQLTRQQVAGPKLGLPNREALLTALRECGGGGECALLVFDCPQYMDLRYSAGEAAAEDLLRHMVSRVQSVLRESDYLAHYDGSDFAVLMRRTRDGDDAGRLAARIQLALDTPVALAMGAVSIRTHVGIALLKEHGSEATALLRHAETAKFAAAARGRDAMVYAARLEAEYAERPRLATELHGALAHEGLVDEYRLQAPLQGGLAPRLRLAPVWPHPRRQRLEEAEFLDLPDRLSLIYGLTLWQLSQALSRSVAWTRSQRRPQVAIRLGDNALALGDLAASVLRLLAAHDLEGRSLALEITERSLLQHDDQARRQLPILRDEGVATCLVDLGGAGTSASTPLRYAISQVTLSPQLMREAAGSAGAERVLRAYVGLSLDLGLKLVAGGLDDTASLERARALGCHWGDGQCIGAATPAAEVAKLLAA